MPKDTSLDETFAKLRGILAPHGKRLLVEADGPGDYRLSSRTMKDRAGRPLFVAAVQTKKNYVSFHLMPIYAVPALPSDLSPALKKRMQGKACFNFKTIDAGHVKELAALTKTGMATFERVTLPWAKQPTK